MLIVKVTVKTERDVKDTNGQHCKTPHLFIMPGIVAESFPACESDL